MLFDKNKHNDRTASEQSPRVTVGGGYSQPIQRPQTTAPSAAPVQNPMVAAIMNGLQRGEFVLYYQPIFSLASGGAEQFEALIRWQTSDGSLKNPGEFIPQAERAGLISRIDKYVLNKVCKDISEHFSNGTHVPSVSINLSSDTLREYGCVENIVRTTREYGLEPSVLTIEISEDTLLSDVEFFAEVANSFVENGISVTIDNYGKNDNTSIHCLAKVNCTNVKFDRKLLDYSMHSARGLTLLVGIINLVRSIDVNVIAERVENEEQLDNSRNLGFNLVQGFYFSGPLSASEAAMYVV